MLKKEENRESPGSDEVKNAAGENNGVNKKEQIRSKIEMLLLYQSFERCLEIDADAEIELLC